MRFSPGAALLLICALCVNASATIIRYVDIDYDKDSSDNENGLTWETEFNTIQEGVDAAFAAGGGEVWVAEGTYTGTGANVVVMATNVHLYGGFTGTGTERNWTQHQTIIDGEDDGENGRRGVFCSDVNNTTLDGFTITHGYAYNGSAMYNFNSSPAVTNCTFSYNTAGGDSGGGIYNNHSSPTLTNCVFAHNTAVRDDTRDSDGDGYTDAEEYAYLCLYYPNPLYDPSTNPPSYPHYDEITNIERHPPITNWRDCPTVQLTVVIKGEGTVWPPAGTYTLAKYAYGCSTCTTTNPVCDYNMVTFAAQPTEGWKLRRWWGDMEGMQELSGSVDMREGRYVVADFRPSVDNLDLVSDLAALLAAFGIPETVNTFDRNAIAYDENAERVYVANGIPDAAELYLIQRVLRDVNYDRSSESGAVHDTVWKAWDKNLRQAQVDFAGMDMAVIRAVAGYMTLGDFGSVAMLTALIEEYANLPGTFDPSAYDRTQQRFFNSEESAANNGVFNIDHWQMASPDGSLDNLNVFGDQALGNASLSSSLHGLKMMGGGSEKALPLGTYASTCPNDACRPHGPLTICPAIPPGSATIRAWRGDGSEMPIGTPVEVYYGEKIKVEATPTDEDYVLDVWAGADMQISGSRNPTKTFLHMYPNTIARPFFTRGQLGLPLILEDSFWVITTNPESEVVTEEDKDGNLVDHRYIFGKPWATASLSAHIVDSPQNQYWYVDGWAVGQSSSLSEDVTMLVSGNAAPAIQYHYPPYTPPKKASYWGMEDQQGGVVQVGGYYAAAYLGVAKLRATNEHPIFFAVAKPGYQFDGWDEYPGQPNYFTLQNVSGPLGATARFKPIERYLLKTKVALAEAQGGPAGAGCAECAGYFTTSNVGDDYAPGTLVTLTAHPNPGYVFVRWDLDFFPFEWLNEILDITMFTDVSATAIFRYDPILLYQEFSPSDHRRILSYDDPETTWDDRIAVISAAPTMPSLFARVQSASAQTQATWQLAIHWDPPNDSWPEEDGLFPPTPQSFPGNQPWPVPWGDAFIGGVATLSCTYCDNITATLQFSILGLNPDDGAARQYIDDGSGVHWYMYAIAKWESHLGAEIYNQFIPPTPGLPRFGGPHGFGMVQIDPPDNVRQVWDWHANVEEGVERINDKRDGYHQAAWWINEQIRQQTDERPDLPLENEVFTYNGVNFQQGTARTPTDACTIQAYNGADERIIAWENRDERDVTNFPGRWVHHANDYVDDVCGELDP